MSPSPVPNLSPFFRRRNTEIRELMDDPDCDEVRLRRTYRLFGRINTVVAQWPKLFRRYLLPEMQRAVRNAAAGNITTGLANITDAVTSGGATNETTSWHRKYAQTQAGDRLSSGDRPIFTLLDVGCGLLDNGLQLQALAARHGFRLVVTGIDPSPVAAAMLGERPLPPDTRFETAFLDALVARGERYDFVISNHLLHHLSDAQVVALLGDVAAVTRRVAVMNDLRRAVVPWMVFAGLMWPMRGHTFLHTDGLRSIRRSFRGEELRSLVGQVSGGGWQVAPIFPYRNAVICRGFEAGKFL
jgi:2-polyprenyl-3-methyl-5-hydroxy-6-metoxy-1,4-benzoquinol methylase